jgi:hypothetical protein
LSKATNRDGVSKGLETCAVGEKHYNGMVLGNIETNPNPLYGYDLVGVGERSERGNKKVFEALEPYDPSKHKSESRRFENNSQNRYTRRDDRRNR